ncbi:MAG: 2-C-methyl-D-erythritol 4-phosphate cytidylyltransferase [Deltaproteobacteria bacterium]|nr:2-C-methyl-D-erythritol 4-phosphate cytidylyltransferase [Deltaproteobacteria bacterium]
MAKGLDVKRRGRRVAALIVAAGEGCRMGTPRPKPFVLLKDVPILAYALHPFEICSRIQSLYPVLRQQDLPSWQGEILDRFPFRKTRQPVVGGPSRQDSVRLGLEAITEDIDTVLIHDGARPFVDGSLLDQLLDTMEGVQAAVLAVPARDTMKVVSPSGRVLETPDRKGLWHIQTPQAFDFSVILEAHQRAAADGIVATDDAALVERLGVPVTVVEGSYRNIKITTPEDLIMARALLENGGGISLESWKPL